jgi:aldehyde dehydrogenase (NAD+)
VAPPRASDVSSYYVEPTLLVEVNNTMNIAQQDVLEPVLAVIAHGGGAVRIANDSTHGLSGSVFSALPERAIGIAGCIRARSMSVNGSVWYDADAPYSGYEASGIGRQNGIRRFRPGHRGQVLGRT